MLTLGANYFCMLQARRKNITPILLPIGSEERGELGVGSIPVAILASSQNIKTIALYLHITITG